MRLFDSLNEIPPGRAWALSRASMIKAREIGAARCQWVEENGIPETCYAEGGNEVELHAQGVAGEVIFSRISGLPFDPAIGKIRKEDFTTPDGYTIDVKARDNRDPDLLIPEDKANPEKRCDIYVLFRFEYCPDRVVLHYRGYAFGNDAIRRANLLTLPGKKRPCFLYDRFKLLNRDRGNEWLNSESGDPASRGRISSEILSRTERVFIRF